MRSCCCQLKAEGSDFRVVPPRHGMHASKGVNPSIPVGPMVEFDLFKNLAKVTFSKIFFRKALVVFRVIIENFFGEFGLLHIVELPLGVPWLDNPCFFSNGIEDKFHGIPP